MPSPSREAAEQELRDVAERLRNLSATTAGATHEDSILGFAAQAEGFADRIRDATSSEAADALIAEAARKQAQWTELSEMLTLATQIEQGSDVDEGAMVEAAELKLRSTAEQLRAVANGGQSDIFNAIGRVASAAEAGLAEFLAAESAEQKLEIYARVEESRAEWIEQMEGLQSAVLDGSESQAPTEAPDASDLACEYVDASSEPDESLCRPATEAALAAASGCATSSAWQSGGYNNYSMGCTALPTASASVGCSALSDKSEHESEAAVSADAANVLPSQEELQQLTPANARSQMIRCLTDDDEGLLPTLRRTVAQVRKDDRFEGVHEDAAKLLEQMELASGAIIPEALVQEFPDDLAGAEEKLKATVEPMRKAQWGGFYAKKAAFTVQKYDLYVRKGKMPSLKDEHSELLECAKVCVDVAEFLRKEAQNAILDSVTGLVKQTTS